MPARRLPAGPDLVVLSHLRWNFVWQRPQHLISRLAQRGRRTWFVEEPQLRPEVRAVSVREVDAGPVTRLWLEVPGESGHCGFGDPRAVGLESALLDRIGAPSDRMTWVYTPMALPLALAGEPDVLVYDVMDDLAAFAHAPDRLAELQRELLRRADVVFTGGRSLQESVASLRPDATCFPSGVEASHYAPARALRRRRAVPVAGYVGVIDERIDLQLLADLAAALPDWQITMVGPVLKIDDADLPRARNLHYPGACDYRDLPSVMSGFDVALMPFALNAATRSISPTKTLEYLAAGLPVVSTRVPDVVASFAEVVALADDAGGFAAACRTALGDDADARHRRVDPLLRAHDWDGIAGRMGAAVARAGRRGEARSA
jgi:glycosyltransferase involved in cell wall biosynthesis